MNKEKDDIKSRPFVGGQALIEGVMFRAPGVYGFAVRKPEKDIHIRGYRKESMTSKFPFKLPFIRGIFALWESMSLGTDMLSRSAEIAMPEEENKKKDKPKKKKSNARKKFEMTITIAFSFVLGLGLFVGVPYLITHYLIEGQLGIGETNPLFHAVDGVLRIMVFLIYIIAIGFMKDVRRLFGYHGAEHKVINCYEKGGTPTVETARESTRFHPRCGTSFIVILLLVLIVIHSITFLFVPESFSYILKLLIRLALIIPIAGISYELIRLGSKFPDSKIVNFLLLPGIATQFFTTREPDDEMLEVSLASFNHVLELQLDEKLEDDTDLDIEDDEDDEVYVDEEAGEADN